MSDLLAGREVGGGGGWGGCSHHLDHYTDCLVRSYKNVEQELVLPPLEMEHVLTCVYTDIPRCSKIDPKILSLSLVFE